MRREWVATLGWLLTTAGLAGAQAPADDPWAIPAEGSCTPSTETADVEAGVADVAPPGLVPGEIIGAEQMGRLRDYLPPEVWEYKDRFFFKGMNIEIGPCYRDYSPPDFFTEATRRLSDQVRLDDEGRLKGYRAGLPFPPGRISPEDPRAGLMWAWNTAHRYAAAGSFGTVRFSWVERSGVTESIEGTFFEVAVAGRADRGGDDYRLPVPTRAQWVSGGLSESRSDKCGWRQYGHADRPSDLFFYVPGAGSRVRRALTNEIEGPLYGCGGRSSLLIHGGVPNLHDWTLLGTRDVIAPINATRPTFPDPSSEERGFGPWGISLANDRWEMRRALVLEGRLLKGSFEDRVDRYVWYLDLQTLVPLYYIAYREGQGEEAKGGVGIFAMRWSEDRSDYPSWPDDPERPVRVLDFAAAVLADWTFTDAVRIEAWDSVAIGPPVKELKKMVSQSRLLRER